VRALFDQYAPKFEKALVDDLGYRGPALLFKAVLAVRQAVRKPAFFKRAIDLGCGTGLAAAAFASEVDHFTGIDLSPRMIERAHATGLYAELEVADMVQGLRDKPDASADLVLAADAMVYLSDLTPLLREVKRVLVTGGLLAYTGMAATVSFSARGCVMPTVPAMCARRLAMPGLRCRGVRIYRPATRTTRRFPALSWLR
jgi:predicted TPR repeat methyltransferase